MSPDTLAVTLRALALCALFQAVGAAMFLLLLLPPASVSWAAVRRLALAAVGCALLLALAPAARCAAP